MRQKITLSITVVFLLISNGLFAQNIGFDYDAAGNRISRYVINFKSTDAGDKNNNTPKEYTDVFEGITVKICPNPNKGKFDVKLIGLKNNGNKQVRLFMYNTSGKPIYHNEQPGSINSVDISTRENGVYYLNILVNNKKRVWKIIKQ